MDAQLYGCTLCGYKYDPRAGDTDRGIASDTSFTDLPDDWVCPRCGAAKADFMPIPIPPAHPQGRNA